MLIKTKTIILILFSSLFLNFEENKSSLQEVITIQKTLQIDMDFKDFPYKILNCNTTFKIMKTSNSPEVYEIKSFQIFIEDDFVFKNINTHIRENQLGFLPHKIENGIIKFDYENDMFLKNEGKIVNKWIKLLGEVDIKKGTIIVNKDNMYNDYFEMRSRYGLNRFQQKKYIDK